jgi:multidrug resistance protein, MATE family
MPRLTQVKADLGAIFSVGGPLIINNISSIGVNVADTLMAARLGSTQLAAVAIGSGVWIAYFLLGLGTIMALGPTVAQDFGGGRYAEIGHDTRQGFWLTLVVSAIVIIAMRTVEPGLLWIGIDATVAVLAQGYLDAMSWGVIGAYGYHTLKQMSEGVGRTVPIMTVMGVALPINILMNYSFMYGRFGADPLGAVGCGLGNGISFWLMFIMLALYTARSRHYQRFDIWRGIDRPDPAALRRLVILGLPIGLSLFMQSGLFTVVALLMGTLGTAALAAHQVVLNYSGLVFMIPLGLGMALTVVVGQAIGRQDIGGAARIGFTGVALCMSISLFFGITTFVFAGAITRVYVSDPQVVAVSITLFRIAALLQIGDATQVAAAFALRGLKDTRVPMILNAFNYWGVGFTLAYGLGIYFEFGARGIWIGLTAALWTAAILLIGRFVIVMRRMRVARPVGDQPANERHLAH